MSFNCYTVINVQTLVFVAINRNKIIESILIRQTNMAKCNQAEFLAP